MTPTTTKKDLDTQALSRYFRVLGDPTRLAIVQALLDGERTVSDIVDLLDLPQSRISNHLAFQGIAHDPHRR